MHNFNVTLKESDIVVPNTGMITHHDTYSGDTIIPTIFPNSFPEKKHRLSYFRSGEKLT